jgi:hypothetical protein
MGGALMVEHENDRGAQSRMKMGFCGDRIGPAGWWLRVAPAFYPPFPTRSTRRDRETFGHGHPKRGGNGRYF